MIKLILKYSLYLIFFVATLIFFFPKENLYYFFEQKLFEKKVTISEEKIGGKATSFFINSSSIYFENNKISDVKNIDIDMFFFSNTVKITNVKIVDDLKNIVPSNIKFINFTHSVKNPIFVNIHSKGEFGEIFGTINLLNQQLKLNLQASKKMKSKYKNILKQMKFEKGAYFYEYQY